MAGDENGDAVAPKSKSKAPLTPEQRAQVVFCLSDERYARSGRAQYMIRKCGKWLSFSSEARLLYVLLAGFMTKGPVVGASRTAMAGWLGVSPRTITRAVAELTRDGEIPLLRVRPGRPGRVSQFEFVHDPWAVAELQAEDDRRSKDRRQPLVVQKQKAIIDDPSLSPEERRSLLARTGRIRDWATARRDAQVPPGPATRARRLLDLPVGKAERQA